MVSSKVPFTNTAISELVLPGWRCVMSMVVCCLCLPVSNISHHFILSFPACPASQRATIKCWHCTFVQTTDAFNLCLSSVSYQSFYNNYQSDEVQITGIWGEWRGTVVLWRPASDHQDRPSYLIIPWCDKPCYIHSVPIPAPQSYEAHCCDWKKLNSSQQTLPFPDIL